MAQEKVREIVLFPAFWLLRQTNTENQVLVSLRGSANFIPMSPTYFGNNLDHDYNTLWISLKLYSSNDVFPFHLFVPTHSTTHLNYVRSEFSGVMVMVATPDFALNEDPYFEQLLQQQRAFLVDLIRVQNSWKRPLFFFGVMPQHPAISIERLMGDTLLQVEPRFRAALYTPENLDQLKQDVIDFFAVESTS
jgi:hypothetical protein